VQFEELLFSNADIVVGTAVIAVRLAGELKARVSAGWNPKQMDFRE
jgi:hypothetical protein